MLRSHVNTPHRFNLELLSGFDECLDSFGVGDTLERGFDDMMQPVQQRRLVLVLLVKERHVIGTVVKRVFHHEFQIAIRRVVSTRIIYLV